MNMKNLILASKSPRRIAMMKEKGFSPKIIAANVEETIPIPLDLESTVMYLALKKALAVEENLTEKEKSTYPVIIAADTVVYHNRIIGKPFDEKDAFNTLSQLRGGSHLVATGVALLTTNSPDRKVFCEITKVYFKDFTDDELLAYVRTDEPYDKAGGYAIQGAFGKYVDHIEGDYENVIGFPWNKIEKELKKWALK
ncbi:MAG: Maf family protein [Anaerovoracaceae bacterium]